MVKYDPVKLQYYTTSHLLRGYAEGLRDNDEYKYEALANMLDKAADLLNHAWNEYQQTLPEQDRVSN